MNDKLIVLDSRICVAENCVEMMRDIETIYKMTRIFKVAVLS